MTKTTKVTSTRKWQWSDVAWISAAFLIGVPITSFIAVPIYYYNGGGPWPTVALALFLGIASNLSITAGYHRLFSHRSYETNNLVKFFLLTIGAGAWQGSCLKWSSEHRVHHAHVDEDQDPYSISRGFFYAHFGWMLLKDPPERLITAPDLEKQWLIRFQHKYYIAVAVLMGFLLPAAVASLWGDFWGGLWVAGFLRIFLTQHSTFFVNSLSHTLGKRPYSTNISARDSLLVAFLTHGEGYHNFHHRFQVDYRNGIRWWQWDPTKWAIWTLAKCGLAEKLKTIPPNEILKARLQTEAMRLIEKGFSPDQLEQIKEKILSAQSRMRKLSEDYSTMKQQLSDDSRDKVERLRTEMRLAKLEFQAGLEQWRILLSSQVPV